MRKKKGFQEFLREEDGMGTVEVILIIVVLVGLVILSNHRSQLLYSPCSVRLRQRRTSCKGRYTDE